MIGTFVTVLVAILTLAHYLWWPSPRWNLTTADQERMVALLSEAPEPREDVRLACPPTDEDACLVAGQLLQIFKSAGWEVHEGRVMRVQAGVPVPGIVLILPPRVPKGGGHYLRPENVPPNRFGTEPRDNWAPTPGGEGRWILVSHGVLAIEAAFAAVGLPVRRRVDVGRTLPESVLVVYIGPRAFEQQIERS